MAEVKIEVLQFRNSDKEYVTLQDAAMYLHMDWYSVDYYASKGKIRMERMEARWLLDWESVQTFDKTWGGKRNVSYEVKITRPALPE